MNIQAEFDQPASHRQQIQQSWKAESYSETPLIFSVRFPLLAEALRRNVNGVDKMDFQCHFTFLKSLLCDFVLPMTATEACILLSQPLIRNCKPLSHYNLSVLTLMEV